MKRLIYLLIFVVLAVSVFAGDIQKEKEAIEKTALNYIEGWYSGDAVRMEKALYKDLAKRGVFVNPQNGETKISPVTAEALVNYTKAGAGKKPKDKWGIEVTILDVYKNTASVKIISVDFIDYVHLAKINGEWKMMNVAWEPIKKK
ncbi:nuclear transport factor 2 family protein [candidate division KSB1 bacterium]|nr:nuclear transport factor 2 family protein [candidate division KSB1 bacterium]MBL7092813.1 nuclear transport factor 2 family protein [candidate division KSB1 bacterium]